MDLFKHWIKIIGMTTNKAPPIASISIFLDNENQLIVTLFLLREQLFLRVKVLRVKVREQFT